MLNLDNHLDDLQTTETKISWTYEGDGWYYAPDDFAMTTAFMTNDFEKFSFRSRRRWDFFEYIKSFIKKTSIK